MGTGRQPFPSRRGAALLAVLWLTACLAAIAFAVANTVRSETERTSTALDGVRAYYLATGAIDRGMLYLLWGLQNTLPQGGSRYYWPGAPVIPMQFPSGETVVEFMPETAKLNINNAPPEELLRVLVNVGTDPDRAREIVMAILDWRTPSADGALSPFDSFYLSLQPSFRARHSSIEEIEELLLVRGMTPELFYGTYDRDPQGRLTPRGGLRACVSVFGGRDRIDVNSVHPAVLGAIGLAPDEVQGLIARRTAGPIQNLEQLRALGRGPGWDRLGVGGNTIFTLRATARLRLPNGQLSDLRRMVAAMVKVMPANSESPLHILRWYDNAWSN